jgi:hypothetical protein
MEAFGTWWIPEAPDNKYSGTLSWNEDSELRLAVLGCLEPTGNFDQIIPTILGVIPARKNEGREVTLKDCFVTRVSYPDDSLGHSQELFAHRAFFGAHLPGMADLRFGRADLCFSGLSMWAKELTGISRPAGHMSLAWDHPKESAGGAFPEGKFWLGLGCSLSGAFRERVLKEEISIVFNFDEPVLESVLQTDIVYPLQNFFTFATDHPNALTSLRVSRGSLSFERIRVVGPRTFSDETTAAEVMPFQMLFSYEDVSDRLGEVVSRWFDLSKTHHDAFALYFGGIYRPAGYTDLRLAQVLSAISLYSAKRVGGQGADTLLYGLARQLQPHAPPALTDLIRSLLESHPVLRVERTLRALGEENKIEFAPLLAEPSETGVQAFVKQAADAMTYIITRNPLAVARVPEGPDYHWLAERAGILFKISVLKDLGFTSDQIQKRMDEYPLFRHIRDHVRKAELNQRV